MNPYLKNVTSERANYSSFAGHAPAPCKSALQTALDEFGCCINMFNDTINQVLLPHISGRVMTACDLASPGNSTSVLSLGRTASITAKASAAWIYICLVFLSGLVSTNNYIICYVCVSEDDIYDVIKELTPVSAQWCSIGLSLRLKRALSQSIAKSGGD